MTNLEKLKEASNGGELLRMWDYFHGGCRQNGTKSKEVYKTICLSAKYRGMYGCQKCRKEFWDMEYEEGE